MTPVTLAALSAVLAGIASALSSRPRLAGAVLGVAVALALGAGALDASWTAALVVVVALAVGALAAAGPSPDPADLPPLRLPPGGRGPAGVADDEPQVCTRCGRRPCACRRPREGVGEELVDPLDQARRALDRA